MNYDEFLRSKVCLADSNHDAELPAYELNPALKPHQAAAVRWAIDGGRRAVFAAFGLGKTIMQLEMVRVLTERTNGRGLIVCPLGVRQEFIADS